MVDTELTPNTSYHPQEDGKTKIVNKWIEGYLRNYVTWEQKACIRWLHLGEYCYNTNFHILIGVSLFKKVYGYDATSFVEMDFGDRRDPKVKD